MSNKIIDLIDKLCAVDKDISKVQHQLKKLEAEYTKYNDQLLVVMQKSKLSSAKTKSGTAIVNEQRLPQIKDRAKFWKYVREHKAFDLVQNRISSTAYFERLEDGEKVPGVDIFTKKSVSIRRR